jgi:deazaflavin-dependent oxidoreductase (nitroreductase family)
MAKKEDFSRIEYLYLTTVGRISGRPREIEIWFVESQCKLYLLAEHFHDANWVKNIECNPRVHVRIGDSEFDATARALDEVRDRETWLVVQSLAREKFGWGDGLPVEIVRDP